MIFGKRRLPETERNFLVSETLRKQTGKVSNTRKTTIRQNYNRGDSALHGHRHNQTYCVLPGRIVRGKKGVKYGQSGTFFLRVEPGQAVKTAGKVT